MTHSVQIDGGPPQPAKSRPGTAIMFGIPEPELARLAALAGVGSVILDGEHGFPLDGFVQPVVSAVKGAGSKCIARIGKNALSRVAPLADVGVDGFILSSPDRLSDLDELTQEAMFVDRGRRSVNPFVAAAGIPGDISALRATSASLELWAMAESPAFLQAMRDAVASRHRPKFWTGIIIGPYDLASSLRCEPDPSDPKLSAAVLEFAHTASALGVRCGLFVRDPSMLVAWSAVGVAPNLVVIGYDRDVWFQECRRRVATVHEELAAAAGILTMEGGA